MISVAFSVWAVAAIMLSAIGMLYLWRISAEVSAICGFTFVVLKSFWSRVVLSFAVWRPSFLRVSRWTSWMVIVERCFSLVFVISCLVFCWISLFAV